MALAGLAPRAELNGSEVVLLNFFPADQRWAVKVVSSSEQVKVRRANLVPLPR